MKYVTILVISLFIGFSITPKDFNAQELDRVDERKINIIDPFTNKTVKTLVPDDYQLITNFEQYQQHVTEWVKKFARGIEGQAGYNKPMILDRIDEDGHVIKGRPKISIDEKQLIQEIILLSFSSGKIKIPLLYTNSDYKKEDPPLLTEVTIASYTTFFNSNQIGRSKNIELSSIAIDNVIVGSKDIFSFNTMVGPREVSTGYQEAPEIIKGKIVMGIGGGICQTSSTLFNAVDQLQVKTIERHHHSKDVGYVPKERDATVSFGGLDYRFQNTTGIPFLIKSYYGKGWLTVQIKTSREYEAILKNELS